MSTTTLPTIILPDSPTSGPMTAEQAKADVSSLLSLSELPPSLDSWYDAHKDHFQPMMTAITDFQAENMTPAKLAVLGERGNSVDLRGSLEGLGSNEAYKKQMVLLMIEVAWQLGRA